MENDYSRSYSSKRSESSENLRGDVTNAKKPFLVRSSSSLVVSPSSALAVAAQAEVDDLVKPRNALLSPRVQYRSDGMLSGPIAPQKTRDPSPNSPSSRRSSSTGNAVLPRGVELSPTGEPISAVRPAQPVFHGGGATVARSFGEPRPLPKLGKSTKAQLIKTFTAHGSPTNSNGGGILGGGGGGGGGGGASPPKLRPTTPNPVSPRSPAALSSYAWGHAAASMDRGVAQIFAALDPSIRERYGFDRTYYWQEPPGPASSPMATAPRTQFHKSQWLEGVRRRVLSLTFPKDDLDEIEAKSPHSVLGNLAAQVKSLRNTEAKGRMAVSMLRKLRAIHDAVVREAQSCSSELAALQTQERLVEEDFTRLVQENRDAKALVDSFIHDHSDNMGKAHKMRADINLEIARFTPLVLELQDRARAMERQSENARLEHEHARLECVKEVRAKEHAAKTLKFSLHAFSKENEELQRNLNDMKQCLSEQKSRLARDVRTRLIKQRMQQRQNAYQLDNEIHEPTADVDISQKGTPTRRQRVIPPPSAAIGVLQSPPSPKFVSRHQPERQEDSMQQPTKQSGPMFPAPTASLPAVFTLTAPLPKQHQMPAPIPAPPQPTSAPIDQSATENEEAPVERQETEAGQNEQQYCGENGNVVQGETTDTVGSQGQGQGLVMSLSFEDLSAMANNNGGDTNEDEVVDLLTLANEPLQPLSTAIPTTPFYELLEFDNRPQSRPPSSPSGGNMRMLLHRRDLDLKQHRESPLCIIPTTPPVPPSSDLENQEVPPQPEQPEHETSLPPPSPPRSETSDEHQSSAHAPIESPWGSNVAVTAGESAEQQQQREDDQFGALQSSEQDHQAFPPLVRRMSKKSFLLAAEDGVYDRPNGPPPEQTTDSLPSPAPTSTTTAESGTHSSPVFAPIATAPLGPEEALVIADSFSLPPPLSPSPLTGREPLQKLAELEVEAPPPPPTYSPPLVLEDLPVQPQSEPTLSPPTPSKEEKEHEQQQQSPDPGGVQDLISRISSLVQASASQPASSQAQPQIPSDLDAILSDPTNKAAFSVFMSAFLKSIDKGQ